MPSYKFKPTVKTSTPITAAAIEQLVGIPSGSVTNLAIYGDNEYEVTTTVTLDATQLTQIETLITPKNAELQALQQKTASLSTTQTTFDALTTDESNTDTQISAIAAHITDLQTAKDATNTTLNAANLKTELRAVEVLQNDMKGVLLSIKDELRKHRQILKYIKDTLGG